MALSNILGPPWINETKLAAWLLAVTVVISASITATVAVAQVTCTGVPFTQNNANQELWYFDTSVGTCGNGLSGFGNPRDGFTFYTDDDELRFAEFFNFNETFGITTSSLASVVPVGVTVLNITPNSAAQNPAITSSVTNPAGGLYNVVFVGAVNASFNFIITLTFQGVAYTIELSMVATDDNPPTNLGSHQVTSMTITGGLFGGGPTSANAASQIATGSHLMFQGASQNISTGIGNAIAERFFEGQGSSFNIGPDGSSLNAYVSVRGTGQAAQDMRSSRLAMYDAPEAVRAIFEATGGLDAGVDGSGAAGEEVSPYLLGADVVPLVDSGPDVVRLNAWVRGTYTHYDGDSFSGDTWNGVAGMDYLLTDDLLIGVLAGYENGDFDFDTTNGEFEGSGFTAGVYVGARLSESIVADAFLTHSWLNYDTRAGTATGSTDASRWLVSMNVTGSYGLTDTLILEPNVRVFYAHETQDGYTLSDATVVAENSIDSSRLSLGPRLRYLVAEDWSAFISAHGEYVLSSETQTNTTLPDFDGLLSARIGLGIDGMFWNG